MTSRVPVWGLLGFVSYAVLYLAVCQSIWNYPAQSLKSAFFKVLPVTQLLIITKSVEMKDAGFVEYKRWIGLGLMFSVGGDVSLVWRVKLFIPGLLFFAVGQACYIRAFRFEPFGRNMVAATSLIMAGCTFLVICPGLINNKPMYFLVFMYTMMIFTMAWRAVVCYQTWPSFGTLCASLGATLFVISDFMIAYDKFRDRIEGAPLYVMITYFLAQLGIAMSVACYLPRSRVTEKIVKIKKQE